MHFFAEGVSFYVTGYMSDRKVRGNELPRSRAARYLEYSSQNFFEDILIRHVDSEFWILTPK